MDNSELIDLFYSRAYEKFVNIKILDDRNYIVPRQQLINYVHELVNIPYIDYINYIKQGDIDRKVEPSDITQFSSFSTCELEMCKALIWANNPGCQYVDIGRFFPNKIISRNDSAYRRLGESHIKAATQLGLTFNYYNYWYLSCLGYIYPDLDDEIRMRLLARTITRNRFYQQLLIDILEHDVKPDVYMDMLSEQIIKRRLRNVYTFFDLCLSECMRENIKTYSLIKNYDVYEKPIQLPLGTNKNLRTFLNDFDYHSLSGETTVGLIKRYRKGDSKAYDILVKSYMRLVLSIAKNYVHKGVDYEDLIQEGVIGLVKSFDHYNVDFNGGFSKYAQWWIRQAITETLVTQPLIVKVPLNVLTIHKKVWNFIEKFEQECGFPPSEDNIEIDSYTDYHTVKYIINLPEQINTLTINTNNWDDIACEDSLPDASLMKESQSHYVFSLLRKLSGRQAKILQLVYGIGEKEETLSSIADRFGYSRERIRQIKERAIKELQKIVSSNALEEKEESKINEDDNDVNDENLSCEIEDSTILKEDKRQFERKTTNKVDPIILQIKKQVVEQNNRDVVSIAAEPFDKPHVVNNIPIANTIEESKNIENDSIAFSTEKIYEIFNNTVSSYKYYWFISILQILQKKNESNIYVYDIIARMVANAWYQITCNRLSFGNGDSFHKIVRELQIITNLPNNAKVETVYKVLENRLDESPIKRQLQILTKNVPYRFLTPWMETNKNGHSYESQCLYSLRMETECPYIIINPLWKDYLVYNYEELISFSYRQLSSFLQKRNPQVDNILTKLKDIYDESNDNTSIFYTVVNTGNHCVIIDNHGIQTYSSTGKIKQVGALFYRISYTYSFFSINQICKSKEGNFTTGKRIVLAKHRSPLYGKLNERNYLDSIEDINSKRKGRVKVNGNWYDENGNELFVSYELTTNNREEQHITKESKREIQPHINVFREAVVGDRIIYDTKCCTVIEKKTMNGSLRLVVRYDNGTIDNLQNDGKRYRVI